MFQVTWARVCIGCGACSDVFLHGVLIWVYIWGWPDTYTMAHMGIFCVSPNLSIQPCRRKEGEREAGHLLVAVVCAGPPPCELGC